MSSSAGDPHRARDPGKPVLYLSETEHQGVAPSRQMSRSVPSPPAAHIAARLGVAEGDDIVVPPQAYVRQRHPHPHLGSYFSRPSAEETGLDPTRLIEEDTGSLRTPTDGGFGHAVRNADRRMPTPRRLDRYGWRPTFPSCMFCGPRTTSTKSHIHTLEFRPAQPTSTSSGFAA